MNLSLYALDAHELLLKTRSCVYNAAAIPLRSIQVTPNDVVEAFARDACNENALACTIGQVRNIPATDINYVSPSQDHTPKAWLNLPLTPQLQAILHQLEQASKDERTSYEQDSRLIATFHLITVEKLILACCTWLIDAPESNWSYQERLTLDRTLREFSPKSYTPPVEPTLNNPEYMELAEEANLTIETAYLVWQSCNQRMTRQELSIHANLHPKALSYLLDKATAALGEAAINRLLSV